MLYHTGKPSGPLLVVLIFAAALSALGCSDPETEKLRHLERGDKYAAEHRDDFAVLEYASAVRIDPKFGKARFKLAETYERMNNLRAAAPEYIRAADALPDDRDVQLKAITVLLLGGRFEDARTRATALLAKDPKDVEAILLRANAMAALKDPAGAITEIEDALKLRPDDSRTYMNLGAIRMQSGDAKEAELAFKQAIALQPSSVEPHLAFANYLWAAGRGSEAEQEIKQALALQPQHLLANRMLGVLYIATQRTSEAEKPLKAVANISKTPAARFQLAEYYVGVRRNDEATKLLAELAVEPASFAQAETMLASLEYSQGRVAEAHVRLDRVLARAPNYAPVLVKKAQWLTTENKLDEALDRAKGAVAADPQSPAAHFALAMVHDRRHEVAEAIKSYTEVLRLNPRAVAAQIELSRLNLASGKGDVALRYAQEAKQTEPDNYAAHAAVARSLLARGDLAAAEVEIALLLRSHPDVAVGHALYGAVQAARKNAEGARKSFERALELSPGMVEALGGLSALDIQAKRVEVAVGRIDSELAKQPSQPELLAMAAQVYAAAGQGGRAEQALRRAVAADPRFSAGYAMLAQFYVRNNRLDEARAEFEGMVKRDPGAAGPRTMVGVILETQGKRAEARKWYEATVAATNDAPVAANNLAFIYAEEGTKLDEALQLATAAKQGLPANPDVDDTLGWVYYKKGLASLAVGPLQDSVKQRPNSAEVHYHLGMTYAKLGEEQEARETLERALKLNPQFPGNEIARQTLTSLAR